MFQLLKLRATQWLLRRLAAMDEKIHDEPSCVDSEQGHVFVDGPDGVAVGLTPEAAEETGERLIGKAADAAAHRRRNSASESGSREREAQDRSD